VISQYPCLTETFVAREIEQLVKLGQKIIICPLRPPAGPGSPAGLTVPGVQVERWQMEIRALLAAQVWLLRRLPSVWWDCWRDILGTSNKVTRLHHLVYILLVTTWMARQLQGRGVRHIRGHFLHSEAIASMWIARMLKVPYSLTAHVISVRHSLRLIENVVKGATFVTSDTQQIYNFLRLMQNARITSNTQWVKIR
jgi:hypothetical protein